MTEDIRERIKSLEPIYEDLCNYYCLSVRDMKSEEFCEKFEYFVKNFENGRKRLANARAEAERKAKIEANKTAPG